MLKLIIILLFLSFTGYAQTYTSVVKDKKGKAIPAVTVTFYPELGAKPSVTDRRGKFTIPVSAVATPVMGARSYIVIIKLSKNGYADTTYIVRKSYPIRDFVMREK